MNRKKQWVPLAGLAATMGIAVYMVVQLVAAQGEAAVTGNFTNAALAEVKDAQGQVVLQGQFAAPDTTDDDDDDVERKAVLKPVATGASASGEAEVEFSKTTPATQEVEFSATGLQAGATFTFVIDGTVVATAAADDRGKAEVELDVKMPGAAARR